MTLMPYASYVIHGLLGCTYPEAMPLTSAAWLQWWTGRNGDQHKAAIKQAYRNMQTVSLQTCGHAHAQRSAAEGSLTHRAHFPAERQNGCPVNCQHALVNCCHADTRAKPPAKTHTLTTTNPPLLLSTRKYADPPAHQHGQKQPKWTAAAAAAEGANAGARMHMCFCPLPNSDTASLCHRGPTCEAKAPVSMVNLRPANVAVLHGYECQAPPAWGAAGDVAVLDVNSLGVVHLC